MEKTSTSLGGQHSIQSNQTCKIRFAEDKDIFAITDFIIDLCNTLGREYDLDSIHDIIFLGIDKGIGLVGEMDGKVVGCMAAMVYPSVFNNYKLEAQELLWYVLPEYRKLKIGLELLKQLEVVCKQRKVTRLFVMAPHHKDSIPFEKYFTRKGYNKLETTFTKEFDYA